jgi:hypothetical protein
MQKVYNLVRGRVGLHAAFDCSYLALTNTETGKEFVLSAEGASLFEIWVGDSVNPLPEDILKVSDFNLSIYEHSPHKLVWAGESAGVYVELGVSVLDSGLTNWCFRILNQGSREVTDVIFPVVSQLTPADRSFGFTIPANNGWWLPFDPLDDDESLTWNYPIFGSMQWIDFCGRSEGLYVGCHDEVPVIKLMCAGKQNGLGHISIRFTDTRIRPGELWLLPPIVIAPHSGDWRSGARIYREWAESWMEKPEIPEWVLRKPHWAWIGMKGQYAKKPERVYADLPKESAVAAEYGIEVLQVGGWLENGHDTHYPNYVAGESLGGEEGLRTAVKQIHAVGRRIALYTNGRIVDPKSELLKGLHNWKSWMVRGITKDHMVRVQKLHANFDVPVPQGETWDSEGTLAKELYGIEFAVACPSCKEWQDLYKERIEYIARAYEVDGIYLDQVCGCWSLPCYAENHNHRRPNESWHGYVELLKELRLRLRSANPEIYLSTEGVCDILGQYFDMLQGHNDWDTQVGEKARPMPELFRYTFPWLVVCTGPVYDSRPDLLNLAHLVGSGYDFCTMPPGKTSSQMLLRAKKVMEWRERFWEDMVFGEFLGPCETSHPDYKAFAFQGQSYTILTLAWVPWKSSPSPPKLITIHIPCEYVCDKALLITEAGEQEMEIQKLEATLPFIEVGMLAVRRKK